MGDLKLGEDDDELLHYCRNRAHALRNDSRHLNDYYPGIPCANFGCKNRAVEGFFFCSQGCLDHARSRSGIVTTVNKLTGYSEFPPKSE